MAGTRQFDPEAPTAEVSKPPEDRKRIQLWEALGSEQQLQAGGHAWVIFADVIARIALKGPWTVTRRGPRMLKDLTTSKTAATENEIHVLARDSVLCLQRGLPGPGGSWDTGELVLEPSMIVGEVVEPIDEPEHDRSYIDIVRVSR